MKLTKIIALSLLQISISAGTYWDNQYEIKVKQMYKNPVTEFGCADPAVYVDGDTAYLSCTRGNFSIYESSDFTSWDYIGRTIINQNFPAWGQVGGKNRLWAPHLTKVDKTYMAYFGLNDKKGNSAIGVFKSKDMGRGGEKFHPIGGDPNTDKPLITGGEGGHIDPSTFYDKDTKKRYLLFKHNRNAVRKKSAILMRELNKAGTRFARREKAKTLKVGGATNKDLIEGPEMIKHNGYYYLFYSVGAWNADYKTYVTRSKNIYGPYTGDRLVLDKSRNKRFHNVGHGSAFEIDGKYFYFYHAMDRNNKKNHPNSRYGMLDRLYFENGWPKVNDGTPSQNMQYLPRIDNSRYPKVTLRWNKAGLKNPKYRLDIKESNGDISRGCVQKVLSSTKRSFNFYGHCKDRPNRFILTSKVQMRVCAAQNGNWNRSAKGYKLQCTPFKNLNGTSLNLGAFRK